MTEPQRWTIGKLLDWATGWLSERSTTSPRLDAELLLGRALDAQRLDLYLQFDKPCDADELANFKKLIVRRGRGEPVAYILGTKGFHAIDLAVGPGVLVPRPETEYLVDHVLQRFADHRPRGPVLDLCTGSGAIALALAHAWIEPDGIDDAPAIIASDLSTDALEYARQNAAALGLSEAVTFVRGDGLTAVANHGPFAAIVSNPPYVLTGIIQTLQPDVRDFEPALALDGGADGMNLLRHIARNAAQNLLPCGSLAVELGSPAQGAQFVELLAQNGLAGAAFVAIGPGPTGYVTATMPHITRIAAAV